MVNSSGLSSMNRSACSSEAVTTPGPPRPPSRCARLPPLSQRYQPGLAASLRMPHTVPLQTASLMDAATRPPMNRFSGVSSGRASWTVAYLRPRLMHCPVNAWLTAAAGVPAMRLSTVLAACAPSGMAAWQLIRSGWPDGAAASPAATMRGLSTQVSVSSVSSRPRASVRQPAAGGQLRHPEARGPDRHRAAQYARRRRAPRRRSGPR